MHLAFSLPNLTSSYKLRCGIGWHGIYSNRVVFGNASKKQEMESHYVGREMTTQLN